MRRHLSFDRVSRASIQSRFNGYVDGSPFDICHEWNGRLSRDGYGLFWSGGGKQFRGVDVLAHVAAWELARGPIPEGYECCHHCDNPSCVRLDHLFLGTHKDNMADCTRKGRHWAGFEGNIGKCGHFRELTHTNKSGKWPGKRSRRCRICTTAQGRARYRARQAEKGLSVTAINYPKNRASRAKPLQQGA